jgi:hypothetical protein
MRGAANRVNTVWGESAVSCNTLETPKIRVVLTVPRRRKRTTLSRFEREKRIAGVDRVG